MNIKDIMNKSIIYGDKDNTIEEISSLMKTYDIGFIPIKDNNNYIGVITDRDIIIKALANNVDIDSSVEPFITNNIISIDINNSVEDVTELMSKYQIRRIMIKNKDKYVGIISLSDILSIKLDFNVLKYISKIFMPNDKAIFNNDIDLPQAEIDEFEL